MMKSDTTTILAFALLGTVASGLFAAERDPWNQYRTISENNIFSRVRGAPRERVRSAEPTAPPAPERFMLVRGVVRRGNEYVAVIEDMRNGDVLNLKSGESVLEGRLEEVTLSGVVYVRDDKRLELSLGDNLEKSGSGASLTTGPVRSGSSSSGRTTTSPQGQADVLERLRQRRLRELGQ